MQPRLKSSFWVDALIRRADISGASAFITHKGDAWSPEMEVDGLVRRRQGYDPDLWVVEIEDREGRHFLTEPVNGEPGARETGPKA